MTILPLTYFGPISWWRIFLTYSDIVCDIHENYIKQTYRNRCSILSANGKQNLSIPIKKTFGNHTAFKDIAIENNQRWQQIHYKTIMSAYKASPYYDYYIDDICHIWTKKYNYLIDVCIESINIVSNIIKTKAEYTLSDSYISSTENDIDFRKCKDLANATNNESDSQAYYQVFGDRFGFVPDLCILDKIFNTTI